MIFRAPGLSLLLCASGTLFRLENPVVKSLPDAVAETNETIVLTIADDFTNSRMSEGSEFSLGGTHTVTIPANDNTIGFASDVAATLGENGGTARVAVNVERPVSERVTLNVTIG